MLQGLRNLERFTLWAERDGHKYLSQCLDNFTNRAPRGRPPIGLGATCSILAIGEIKFDD